MALTKQQIAAKATQYQNQLLRAKTLEELNNILNLASNEGVTLNQGIVDRATGIVKQAETRAAAASPLPTITPAVDNTAKQTAAEQAKLTTDLQNQLLRQKTHMCACRI
jgi:hypothetical protein